MRLLTLDCARNTGWAFGPAGEKPRYDVEVLRQSSQDLEVGVAALSALVRDFCYIKSDRPDLIIVEAPMMPYDRQDADGKPIRRSMESIIQPPMLYASVISAAYFYDVPVKKVAPATWRKHFLGKANFGDALRTKAATLDRAKLLGYIPANAVVTNQRADKLYDCADAIGIFDWACYTFAKTALNQDVLHLWGERARGVQANKR